MWAELLAEDCPNVCGFCERGCVDLVPDCAVDKTICRRIGLENWIKVTSTRRWHYSNPRQTAAGHVASVARRCLPARYPWVGWSRFKDLLDLFRRTDLLRVSARQQPQVSPCPSRPLIPSHSGVPTSWPTTSATATTSTWPSSASTVPPPAESASPLPSFLLSSHGSIYSYCSKSKVFGERVRLEMGAALGQLSTGKEQPAVSVSRMLQRDSCIDSGHLFSSWGHVRP